MADNLTAKANTGSGTDVIATDEIGGVHFPRTKIVWGDNGVAVDASATDPLPVTISGSFAVTQESTPPAFSLTSVTQGDWATTKETVSDWTNTPETTPDEFTLS